MKIPFFFFVHIHFLIFTARTRMSHTNGAMDHSSENSSRTFSDSCRSISPTMTEANSDSVGEEDVFKRAQPLAASAPSAISARLHELYDENITAKILRAATTCLERNVSRVSHKRYVFKTLSKYTDNFSVSNYRVPGVCATVGARCREIPASRGRFLDMRLLPGFNLLASGALDQISSKRRQRHQLIADHSKASRAGRHLVRANPSHGLENRYS